MTGVKTNERPGTRAVAKYIRISPYKVRVVLDLIRGQHVLRAGEILKFSERDAAITVGKVLASAVANARNNDGIDEDELYVSACYADEGVTIKRFRPRARGRAGRIRKRTCHITVIVSRMPADQLARFRTKQAQEQQARRARRVAGGRAGSASVDAGGNRGGRFRRGRGGATETGAESVAVEEDVPVEEVEEVEELALETEEALPEETVAVEDEAPEEVEASADEEEEDK
ncbi:MAG: large subunit ribosomal protein [Actinomycetota bacterium]|jgi:large subunit ribosomal protein L22|nr:large subunit ribosomal protein [Actinomycetota bacterium]